MEDINSLEGMLKFREELNDTQENLRKQLQETEAAIEVVSQTWKDAVFNQFREKFSEDKDTILPLCDRIEEYINVVMNPIIKSLGNYGDINF